MAALTDTRSDSACPVLSMRAPAASWIWPKTCSRQCLKSFNLDESVSHPAFFPLFVRSSVPYGGVWVIRISVSLGILLCISGGNGSSNKTVGYDKAYLGLQLQIRTERLLEHRVGFPWMNLLAKGHCFPEHRDSPVIHTPSTLFPKVP